MTKVITNNTMDKIKEQIKTIKNNLFTNNLEWKERGEQNMYLAHKIRETIAMDDTIDKQFIVDTLDWLDSHDL